MLQGFPGLHWLDEYAKRTRAQSSFAYLFRRNYVYGNVAAIDVLFQTLKNTPAVHVRQKNIQRQSGGLEFTRHGQGNRSKRRDPPPEAFSVRHLRAPPGTT